MVVATIIVLVIIGMTFVYGVFEKHVKERKTVMETTKILMKEDSLKIINAIDSCYLGDQADNIYLMIKAFRKKWLVEGYNDQIVNAEEDKFLHALKQKFDSLENEL